MQAWLRFLARYTDVFLFSILFWIFYDSVLAKHFAESSSTSFDIIMDVIILFIWVFLESIWLSTAGTTPGKFLYHISLRDNKGQKLNFISAFRRSLTVFIFGLCAGVPVFSLLALAYSYITFTQKGVTKWDKEYNCQLTYMKIGVIRLILIGLVLLVTLALIITNVVNIFSA
jgi:hypothetical protein